MGYVDQTQTQAAYPHIPSGPQHCPQTGNTSRPPLGAPDAGGTTSQASTAGVTAPGGYHATPAAGPPDSSSVPEASKINRPAPPPLDISGLGAVPVKTENKVNSQDNPCSCSAGWVLFGVGFVFPICWVVAAFLPCCTKTRSDRRAAILSSVMFVIYVVVIVVVAVCVPRSSQVCYKYADGAYKCYRV